jgi:integrase/recombinase XerD
VKGPSFSELGGRYRRYLASARGLSPASIANHIWVFRKFRDFLKARRVRAARRVSLDLAYAFLEQLAQSYARSSMATMHGSVTRILRFLRFSRITPRDLSEDMIAPRTWSLSGIPKGFTDGDIAHMLTAFRTETPYDYRERAVMVLFIYYGLRPGEVAGMNLGDVHWRKKTITIRERKNRVPLVLPILPPVEEAVCDYLLRARPPGTKTRRLFVAVRRGSRGALTVRSIHEVVDRFLRRCGVEGIPTAFRHTLATRLINGGVSIEAIGAVLGHQSVLSTLIYAKVHWEALREVAENHSLLL